jgi:tRNA pseudouridine55 synthase
MRVDPKPRVQRRPVHGVLLLDKPLNLSSNQALQRAKWLLRAEKAGHTGTLDPQATGVLPICFGAATKFSQQHLDARKRYRARVSLGQATSTGDLEGDVTETAPVPAIVPSTLLDLAARLQGPSLQTPPMYSALKKDGKALYTYARAGEDVQREPRQIEIYQINLSLSPAGIDSIAIEMDVSCSKGTYIRTLGEDVAKALGTVGHLTALRRVETGPFSEGQCVTLDELEAWDETRRMASLLPVDALLGEHQPVMLEEHDAARFLSGLRRRTPLPDCEAVRVFGPAHGAAPPLLGSAHIRSGELIPDRLLNPPEIEQIARQTEVDLA